ncbi:MAG TPA: hypothetical protein VN420_05305 [Candidatus Fimivivens sp.]|nr:hypothetical protein [Candidatus Fimivivens sp.]
MEFRDFCLIFRGRWKLFAGIVAGIVFLSLLALLYQPSRFETDLTVNVSRSGMQHTTDYTYDQFYRLQADERFADTVVRWLETPSLRQEIRSVADVSPDVTDSIKASRLSSQMISVSYVSNSEHGAGDMATAIPDVLNRETMKLNELAKDPDWFVVLADEPTMRDARFPAWILLSIGAALGFFAAFWTVLIDWYFRGARRG